MSNRLKYQSFLLPGVWFDTLRLLPKLLYYIGYDVVNYKDRPPYGVYLFLGVGGKGKTASMSQVILEVKEKYPNTAFFTNYKLDGESGSCYTPKDVLRILAEYRGEHNICIGLDETQDIFNSRDWQSLPPSMIEAITKSRKGTNPVMFLMTSQYFDALDKQIRMTTHNVVECRMYFGRFCYQRSFEVHNYRDQEPMNGQRRKIKWRRVYVLDHKVANSYDTYAMIETLKNTDYVKPVQIENIIQMVEGSKK